MSVYTEQLRKSVETRPLEETLSVLIEQQRRLRDVQSPSARAVCAEQVKTIVQELKVKEMWPFVVDPPREEGGQSILRAGSAKHPKVQFYYSKEM